MQKTDLTDRQRQILEFMGSYISEKGYPPTLRDICAYFDIASVNGVKKHLDALQKKGFISVDNNKSRGIILNREEQNNAEPEEIADGGSFITVPLIGRVAAGMPALSEQNREGYLRIDASMVRYKDNVFALKVRGESMINAGIFENDFIIVSPSAPVRNDDIVVASYEGEVTVKRYQRKGNKVYLIPENENFKTIEIENDPGFSIPGKVVGLIRNYN